MLARMLGYQEMVEVMQVITENMFQNLVGSNFESQETKTTVVQLTLETLGKLVASHHSSKLLSQTQLMNRLVQSSQKQIQVLQDSDQGKQLSLFYKILSGLWLTDFDESVFEKNISQLDLFFREVQQYQVSNSDTRA